MKYGQMSPQSMFLSSSHRVRCRAHGRKSWTQRGWGQRGLWEGPRYEGRREAPSVDHGVFPGCWMQARIERGCGVSLNCAERAEEKTVVPWSCFSSRWMRPIGCISLFWQKEQKRVHTHLHHYTIVLVIMKCPQGGKKKVLKKVCFNYLNLKKSLFFGTVTRGTWSLQMCVVEDTQ